MVILFLACLSYCNLEDESFEDALVDDVNTELNYFRGPLNKQLHKRGGPGKRRKQAQTDEKVCL